MRSTIPLLCFALIIMVSCSHDESPYSQRKMSFSADVQPVIQTTCATRSCHSAQGEEFSLENYADIMDKVQVGNARSSELYRVITHRSFTVMPPAPATIADEDVTKIYYWIEQGAQNN